MELRYETRDSQGKEIVKMVQVKEYPVEAVEYTCPICHITKQEGTPIKKSSAVTSPTGLMLANTPVLSAVSCLACISIVISLILMGSGF